MDYKKIYQLIVKRGKNRKLEGYKERHHIIPKCMGGGNEDNNLTELTAKEHFLCHKLLCEIYPNNKRLKYALWLMAIGKRRWKDSEDYLISGKEYERLKTMFINNSTGRKLNSNIKNQIGKKNSKKVYQYGLNGEFIKEWDSCNEAEASLTKNNPHWKNLTNRISACARGELKTSYGFIWKYKKETIEDLEYYNQYQTKNTIEQIDNKGNVINTFNKTEEAKKKLNLSTHMFYQCFSPFNKKLSKKKQTIHQMDLQGNIIKSYPSLIKTKEDGFNPSSISNVINKKSNSSGGYKWVKNNETINYRLRWKTQ